VGSDSDDECGGSPLYRIFLHCKTVGDTALVVVELCSPELTDTTLTFARLTASCGITYCKGDKLTPVEGRRDDSDLS
jgi:hypothetical protein